MSITNANKEASVSNVQCGDSFQITLSLTAEPEIISNPTDIVLILDRSASMSGSPLLNLKVAADKFIDIIAETTGGSQSGEIGYGSHIGIVSFASTATQDTQLITNVVTLKNAVNALIASGSTNHADAFTKASELLANSTANEKVMIMFTDGLTTTGGAATHIADAAKAQGIIIYCIGLTGNGGIDVQALEDWASDPSSTYVSITPNEDELEQIFEDLAKNIAEPGATNIVVTDHINPCFSITDVAIPTKGKADLVDIHTVQWSIDELGLTEEETAQLTFTVQHVGQCLGKVEVNESILYTDDENHTVSFPSPFVFVDCPDDGGYTEPCPVPVNFTIDGCEDTIEYDAGDIALQSLGRIVQLDATLTNVCPNKRVALAVVLTEVDDNGQEHKRGMKVITIPMLTGTTCRNVTVRCIKFVLPEVSALCQTRQLRARFIANYIDNDFDCCGNIDIIND